jgi:microcystin-dependent protein
MSDPFVGEIRLFGGSFAPQNWLFCDGTLLPIAEFDQLFNLIGTTYGGDGETTFAVPDLRSRVPLHQSSTGPFRYAMGETGGTETVTLSSAEMPLHTHAVAASGATPQPATAAVNVTNIAATYVPASPTPKPRLYTAPGSEVPMATGTVQPAGGGQPHDNMGPYLAVNFIISLFGIFPSQF